VEDNAPEEVGMIEKLTLVLLVLMERVGALASPSPSIPRVGWIKEKKAQEAKKRKKSTRKVA
jgi:hypothetical protein